MTETHATISPGAPVFPAGRYGRRRAPGGKRRRTMLAALVLLALVATLTVISVRLYRQYGDPVYDAQVITYTDITDNQVLVDFRVTVPPGGSAVCVLRARDRSGAEVARDQVTVTADPGDRHVTTRHRLATTARPFIGEVLRCRQPS
ncbi:DUF4307 domain-containing protein [Micromonospora ureilytica]|uniref:DUF4307 domain-containing protein n=1 Tax=Micromonospora ureilytica TaxID=709868 RepID=A0A3N9XYN9_9ACTN|nr:DUF4307 domain-containing protein [Micromonospora ureilytica]MBG6067841.1 hypothetical protein [Micromonospora ureilytica]RQX18040.1 DUF4307 domain-containing protein [Micromonospora ureilytica]WSR58687.1 DUF4307 domain-containing protein [Micromonospora ureilytica]